MSGLFTSEIKDDTAAQDRVREWIAALRSGRYEQGVRALHRGDTFCCLGVACDLSGLGEWTGVGARGYLGNVATLQPEVFQSLRFE